MTPEPERPERPARPGRPTRTPGLAELLAVPSVRALTPAYLTEADTPWLRALLEERERFTGQTRRAWRSRLAEPLPVAAPASKLRTAVAVLDRLTQDRVALPVAPRQLRALVFREAAQDPDRQRVLDRAAATFGLPPERVLEALFGDLPQERRLAPLAAALAPTELALACNEALVFDLLARALRVQVTARGNVRAVVRHAKLMGLLCHAIPGASKDEVTLQLSGPYALFRHTRLYGRALASLVPRLAWCNSYRLEADCVMDRDGALGRLVVQSGDPVAPARELPRFDSQVEERFARAFAKLAPAWDLLREPVAIPVGDALAFPDFELRHRASGERWLLEIVGYWTAEYLEKKLAQLRAARIDRLIVCIDDDRCCGEGELADIGIVVRYRRRVDPRAVLAIVDPLEHARLPATKKPHTSAAKARRN